MTILMVGLFSVYAIVELVRCFNGNGDQLSSASFRNTSDKSKDFLAMQRDAIYEDDCDISDVSDWCNFMTYQITRNEASEKYLKSKKLLKGDKDLTWDLNELSRYIQFRTFITSEEDFDDLKWEIPSHGNGTGFTPNFEAIKFEKEKYTQITEDASTSITLRLYRCNSK